MNRIFLVYEQIVKHYIDRIETHDLNQGDSIESEEDIAAAFSVSRGTVRKAMTELESTISRIFVIVVSISSLTEFFSLFSILIFLSMQSVFPVRSFPAQPRAPPAAPLLPRPRAPCANAGTIFPPAPPT